MRILFFDVIQESNASKELKSPMLTNYQIVKYNELRIEFDKSVAIDSIGIGNTDGTYFNIGNIKINFIGNGLYYLNKTFNISELIIETDATYIGRLGAGIGIRIPTAIAKEPAFLSTNKPRFTLSGQTIAGIGGYNYKAISLDSRYKINEQALNEIQKGYKYIGMGYPFFIDLSDEAYKLPFSKLYATEKNQTNISFEGGINKYLYSKRWNFEERF